MHHSLCAPFLQCDWLKEGLSSAEAFEAFKCKSGEFTHVITVQSQIIERTLLQFSLLIGIITPYNKQAHKITRLLKGEDFKEIKVGSAEMFQGQERQNVIISTVRSSLEMLSFDVKQKIGFLNNPKRFNVAVTRASSLLFIFGNPMSRTPIGARFCAHARNSGHTRALLFKADPHARIPFLELGGGDRDLG